MLVGQLSSWWGPDVMIPGLVRVEEQYADGLRAQHTTGNALAQYMTSRPMLFTGQYRQHCRARRQHRELVGGIVMS
jgi:hypothetical protein